MRLVHPSIEFLDMNTKGLKLIETAGRTCYKSEELITEDSHIEFAKKILKLGHHAVMEFGWMCYRVVCDRGVTHEIVRHRLFSYAQESTRYCNYEKKGNVTYVIPSMWSDYFTHLSQGFIATEEDIEVFVKALDVEDGADETAISVWLNCCLQLEKTYNTYVKNAYKPQQARFILPNCLKTEIVIGGNYREWAHFFKLRTSSAAHPDMQLVADMLLKDAQKRIPVIFDGFGGSNG